MLKMKHFMCRPVDHQEHDAQIPNPIYRKCRRHREIDVPPRLQRLWQHLVKEFMRGVNSLLNTMQSKRLYVFLFSFRP